MVRKEFIMNEQIIINWTKTDESETLIVNATINDERIVKVVKDPKQTDIEVLKTWVKKWLITD